MHADAGEPYFFILPRLLAIRSRSHHILREPPSRHQLFQSTNNFCDWKSFDGTARQLHRRSTISSWLQPIFLRFHSLSAVYQYLCSVSLLFVIFTKKSKQAAGVEFKQSLNESRKLQKSYLRIPTARLNLKSDFCLMFHSHFASIP